MSSVVSQTDHGPLQPHPQYLYSRRKARALTTASNANLARQASGQVGSSILTHLLESPHPFKISVVTRTDSSATLPSSVTVHKGAYTDASFLGTAFKSQDVVIFALHFMAQGAQNGMIDAAAKAGVQWIIPNEYAGDGLNADMMNASVVFGQKVQSRRHVEELSKTHEGLRWIGVATNPFFESVCPMLLYY